MEHSDIDLKEVMDYKYDREIEMAVESVIRMGFPDIEKLEVDLKDGMINIQFADGKYTGQEIFDYVEKIKKECSNGTL